MTKLKLKGKKKPLDFPFEKVIKRANELACGGLTVYQKFTCDKCKQRLTMPIANAFYETGSCDRCGHVTDIKKRGCNYTVMTALNLPSHPPHGTVQ